MLAVPLNMTWVAFRLLTTKRLSPPMSGKAAQPTVSDGSCHWITSGNTLFYPMSMYTTYIIQQDRQQGLWQNGTNIGGKQQQQQQQTYHRQTLFGRSWETPPWKPGRWGPRRQSWLAPRALRRYRQNRPSPCREEGQWSVVSRVWNGLSWKDPVQSKSTSHWS